jgi:hypothetical protein
MQYKAWIARSLTFADETIQIVLDDVSNLEMFKDRVIKALEVADHRANELQLRLFEDTSLTDELNYKELEASRSFANKLYPVQFLSHKLDLGNKTSFEFSKNLSGGEVLKLYLHDFSQYEDITGAIQAVWDIIDSRLQRTNSREQKAMEYYSSLSFELQHKVYKIMALLYGQKFKDIVVDELRKEKVAETVDGLRAEALAGDAQHVL